MRRNLTCTSRRHNSLSAKLRMEQSCASGSLAKKSGASVYADIVEPRGRLQEPLEVIRIERGPTTPINTEGT